MKTDISVFTYSSFLQTWDPSAGFMLTHLSHENKFVGNTYSGINNDPC